MVQQLGLADDDDLGLLAALGEDLPGNVRATSSADAPTAPAAIVEEEEHVLAEGLRASLGGVQLKFTLSGHRERLSLSVRDPSDDAWILKIGGPTFPGLAHNEHAIMSWCRRAGFSVPETHVIPRTEFPDLGDIPSEVSEGFLIKRYDRHGAKRIHQEDFAQVLGVRPAYKYKGTHTLGMARIAEQVLGADGLRAFWRRLAVIVATGNADAHLKNWSIVYPDGVSPEWSPLYDQVATIAYAGLSSGLALRIGNAQFFREVQMNHFEWLADRMGIGASQVADEVGSTLVQLRDTFASDTAEMPVELAERLRDHWEEVPLLRRFGLAR